MLHDEVYDLTVMAMPFNEKRRSYYSASTMDGERSGSFYINVEDIKALKKYETMSLALHEGNPGKKVILLPINIFVQCQLLKFDH